MSYLFFRCIRRGQRILCEHEGVRGSTIEEAAKNVIQALNLRGINPILSGALGRREVCDNTCRQEVYREAHNPGHQRSSQGSSLLEQSRTCRFANYCSLVEKQKPLYAYSSWGVAHL
jgi:hypothetical protein